MLTPYQSSWTEPPFHIWINAAMNQHKAPEEMLLGEWADFAIVVFELHQTHISTYHSLIGSVCFQVVDTRWSSCLFFVPLWSKHCFQTTPHELQLNFAFLLQEYFCCQYFLVCWHLCSPLMGFNSKMLYEKKAPLQATFSGEQTIVNREKCWMTTCVISECCAV